VAASPRPTQQWDGRIRTGVAFSYRNHYEVYFELARPGPVRILKEFDDAASRLLSTPGSEHDWSATGMACPICAATTTVNTNGERTEGRDRKRSVTRGNAIDPLRGRLREATEDSPTRLAELTVQSSTLLPRPAGGLCWITDDGTIRENGVLVPRQRSEDESRLTAKDLPNSWPDFTAIGKRAPTRRG
jgi:hypothetical protein